jgi:hypothetical protein
LEAISIFEGGSGKGENEQENEDEHDLRGSAEPRLESVKIRSDLGCFLL